MHVPGHLYVDKPVYVLTSKRTWSAAEGFTESMRRVAHATVVGQTTRGGEHLSRWMTVHPNSLFPSQLRATSLLQI
jgi:C-terminal processing protease CtpA/Prc